jgi:hypothetical protein
LVNDDAEILGADAADEEVLDDEPAPELALELELDDELPQPATTAANARPTAHTRGEPKVITARSSHRAHFNRLPMLPVTDPAENGWGYTGGDGGLRDAPLVIRCCAIFERVIAKRRRDRRRETNTPGERSSS